MSRLMDGSSATSRVRYRLPAPIDTSRSEEPVTSMSASVAMGWTTSVTDVLCANSTNRSSTIVSCMPAAWAKTRYGPPTRRPVVENCPLAPVVLVSVVPEGRCTIVTFAPTIG
jgi:hypothetical protein